MGVKQKKTKHAYNFAPAVGCASVECFELTTCHGQCRKHNRHEGVAESSCTTSAVRLITHTREEQRDEDNKRCVWGVTHLASGGEESKVSRGIVVVQQVHETGHQVLFFGKILSISKTIEIRYVSRRKKVFFVLFFVKRYFIIQTFVGGHVVGVTQQRHYIGKQRSDSSRF